ncbi:AlbA family DNA-binding domain-containing protein [Methylobacterium planeticum]|uniref:ATP-binding protein n=1 Tax=Methylobacterium planeticum TaxID=2615211 RepID=A0A6N6MG64_9HYPH|nr:ATP-binding protein [Methylobacterium planeticum]KAB1068821.1 ATP-binding protein [Methylobacterium planeticum]
MRKLIVPVADAQLEALVTSPREDLHIEVKSWLDLADGLGKATLAKAIIALANHGGGFILLGFEELPGGVFEPAPNRPATLAGYSQDGVNGIVQSYVAPPFHCTVHYVRHPGSGDLFPIIAIPGGHKVPVQAARGSSDNNKTLANGRYYIRRPGPQSMEPSTPEEWRELVGRCVRAGREDLLEAIRDVLSGNVPAAEVPGLLDSLLDWAEEPTAAWLTSGEESVLKLPPPKGYFRAAYAIDGEFERPTLPQLLELLKRSTVRHTGWPAWSVLHRAEFAPFVNGGALECTYGSFGGEKFIQDPGHADYWRASPEGRLFLLRGFFEDGRPERATPGTVFSLTTPVWRVGECLLHAAALAQNLGVTDAKIVFSTRWAGLAGRELKDLDGRRYLSEGYRARQDQIDRSITVEASIIGDGLPEIVFELLTPLYELFDLFVLPRAMVEGELREMRKNSF